MSVELIKSELPGWFNRNKRNLPWRSEKDPYKIWLSEIILQQTRVAQGMDYYLRFTEKFETVEKLALSDLEDVLKLWQGLGYYSRAKNLHFAANQIVERERFPTDFKNIKTLKGVGDYTAAAIASIAFNEAVAAVDGNVYRVLSRYFGINSPIDSTLGKKEFNQLAEEILDHNSPGDWNQAMMEFGAIQCTPKAPKCGECPLKVACVAFQKKQVELLPVKRSKTKQKTSFLSYFHIQTPEGMALYKRPLNGIWGGLHEFPVLETLNEPSKNEMENYLFENFKLPKDYSKFFSVYHCKHVLSHRVFQCTFYYLELDSTVHLQKPLFLTFEPNNYSYSRLMEKYFEAIRNPQNSFRFVLK